MPPTNTTPFRKLFITFALIYTGLLMAGSFLSLAGLLENYSGAPLAIVQLGVPMIVLTFQFVNGQQRVPMPSEKQKLIWGCIAITYILSFLWMILGLSIIMLELQGAPLDGLLLYVQEFFGEAFPRFLLGLLLNTGLMYVAFWAFLTFMAKPHLGRVEKAK